MHSTRPKRDVSKAPKQHVISQTLTRATKKLIVHHIFHSNVSAFLQFVIVATLHVGARKCLVTRKLTSRKLPRPIFSKIDIFNCTYKLCI